RLQASGFGSGPEARGLRPEVRLRPTWRQISAGTSIASQSRVPHVLIADDDRSVREALIACIKSLGLEPQGVDSGDAGVAFLDACDLLISDVRMPGMDGMALLAEARRRRPDLPVIMLTGHATVDLAVQAMRAGAANFIEKPFEIDDLEQAVR